MLALMSQPIEAHFPTQAFELTLPAPTADIIALEDLVDPPVEGNTQWVEVQRGDNLGVIMERVGLGAGVAAVISASPNGDVFRKLRPGTHMELKFDENNQLVALNYHFSSLNIVSAERTDNGFAVQQITKPIESRIVSFAGTIDNSLYIDGRKSGMQVQQIMDMADIFAWDIDFGREIQPGTQFSAVFEVPYADDQVVGSGKLLAARILIGKDEHAAFWHKPGGAHAYFDKDGKSLRKAFNRNPVDYVRITSGFSKARYHPVLHEMRAHEGVDYGAPIGTPVHATGDGKITMRGWGNGYGNMVTIQHGQIYSTVYGHLSKFGHYKAGDNVKQGDVIGYVGMTGLASGPHLHYEFRIKGQHVDPLGVKFVEAEPIAPKEKSTFLKSVIDMTERMDTPTLSVNVAEPATTEALPQLVANFE
jgi:murein DD-endopeptidase MepM/ murein hydrolase activator NlpD